MCRLLTLLVASGSSRQVLNRALCFSAFGAQAAAVAAVLHWRQQLWPRAALAAVAAAALRGFSGLTKFRKDCRSSSGSAASVGMAPLRARADLEAPQAVTVLFARHLRRFFFLRAAETVQLAGRTARKIQLAEQAAADTGRKAVPTVRRQAHSQVPEVQPQWQPGLFGKAAVVVAEVQARLPLLSGLALIHGGAVVAAVLADAIRQFLPLLMPLRGAEPATRWERPYQDLAAQRAQAGHLLRMELTAPIRMASRAALAAAVAAQR